MARIGDTCVSIGNADWYIGDAESYDPTANIDRDFVRSLVGGSVTSTMVIPGILFKASATAG